MSNYFFLPPELRLLFVNKGINLIAAILILVAGWTVAQLAGRWTRLGLNKVPHFDATLRPLIASFIRYSIIAVTIIAVLQRFGVETTSLITILGAAGIAVGLALQSTLSNVAAGVMLLVVRPFQSRRQNTSGRRQRHGARDRTVPHCRHHRRSSLSFGTELHNLRRNNC